MRTRKEIEDEAHYVQDAPYEGRAMRCLELEVLLDIRDMLENVGSGPVPVEVKNRHEHPIPTYKYE